MEHIFEVIRQYQMIEAGMHVLVGVSGGADSVCLLYVLGRYRERIPFTLTAVHVEHGIRGTESLEDAHYVEQLCESLGIPCAIVSVPVAGIAKERRISVEEAGRMERYRVFEEQAAKRGCDRIAVAHNRGDQAETVLWNLVRGSGLAGLCGMQPVREKLIRPLLFTDRFEIEQIVREAGLSWRTDRTNLETQYTRNRIRLTILPQMEEQLNRQAGAHIAQTAQRLGRVQAYITRMTERAAADCLAMEGGDVLLLREPYLEQDELIRQELLRRAVAVARGGEGLRNVTSRHVQMLDRLMQMDCGREYSLPGDVRAVREAAALRIGTKREKAWDEALAAALEITGEGQYGIPGLRILVDIFPNEPSLWPEIIQEKKYTKWLSYDTIKSNVLVRKRRTGDYLYIGACGGRKKLKDYLIDQKIPREQRDRLWIVADGAHVLWVPGYRISEAAKVNKDTKRIMRIQMKEE